MTTLTNTEYKWKIVNIFIFISNKFWSFKTLSDCFQNMFRGIKYLSAKWPCSKVFLAKIHWEFIDSWVFYPIKIPAYVPLHDNDFITDLCQQKYILLSISFFNFLIFTALIPCFANNCLQWNLCITSFFFLLWTGKYIYLIWSHFQIEFWNINMHEKNKCIYKI